MVRGELARDGGGVRSPLTDGAATVVRPEKRSAGTRTRGRDRRCSTRLAATRSPGDRKTRPSCPTTLTGPSSFAVPNGFEIPRTRHIRVHVFYTSVIVPSQGATDRGCPIPRSSPTTTPKSNRSNAVRPQLAHVSAASYVSRRTF